MRHGGKILAEALAGHGVRFAFGVPGESYLPLLDGLHDVRDRVCFVTCRHEGGAAYMAEAYAKLTGEPGVLCVTRAPGAANSLVGVFTALQDSSPMIVLVGQVPSTTVDREAFQEVDCRQLYGPLVKWVGQIDRVERIPEYVSRAFHTATAGRPGPVVLVLPEDMLVRESAVADVPHYRPARAAPAPGDAAELTKLLHESSRPIVVLGGSAWTPEAIATIRAWAEGAELPVVCAFRRQDRFDNRSSSYVGDLGFAVNPKLAERVRRADLVVAVGARLGQVTTAGYALLKAPVPDQVLVHVHPDPEELGRVYSPHLAINSGVAAFVEALPRPAPSGARWSEWTRAARADYTSWIEPQPMPGRVQLGEIVRWLSDTLPEDAIVASGAGNFALWLHRHFVHKRFRTQLAPISGSMGYGVTAAVSAAITEPRRVVVGWLGDGDFLMNGQELATAAQYDAAPILLVVNNAMYGTIRMHQERTYPDRVVGTSLKNPDFAAYARAFGGHGETVEDTRDFAPAFERARAAKRLALIEIRIDPEAILPNATLSGLRGSARQTPTS